MRRITLALAGAALCVGTAAAVDFDVTDADIERIVTKVRGTDRERALFHAPYIISIDKALIESLEVITETRRVAIIAEEYILRGDRAFAYSVTKMRGATTPWKQRVSIVARLRFHPMHRYVTVPPADIVLAGLEPIGKANDPLWSSVPIEPGGPASMYGVRVEATYEVILVGQRDREIALTLERKEIARTRFDFGRVE